MNFKQQGQASTARSLLALAWPMIISNFLQQLYNLVDALIVGHFVGVRALAAIGAAGALLVLLNSILIGLSLGVNVALGQRLGANQTAAFLADLKQALFLTVFVSLLLQLLASLSLNYLLTLLRVDSDIYALTAKYLYYMLAGLLLVGVYNYLAAFLRTLGDTFRPLIALGIAAISNILLDLYFIKVLNAGIKGAAIATLIAQALAVFMLFLMALRRSSALQNVFSTKPFFVLNSVCLKRLLKLGLLSAVQQSIMNFGILLIQSLVNSYGYAVTAAFTAAQRVEAFAYMPVQDFANAFASLLAHQAGAEDLTQIRQVRRNAFTLSTLFALVISACIILAAPQLIKMFLAQAEAEIVQIGSSYLYTVGAFYCLIAWLFLWYAYFRALAKVYISIILTVISLGLRVILAYSLAPYLGLKAIWSAIVIGWLLADLVGFYCMKKLESSYVA